MTVTHHSLEIDPGKEAPETQTSSNIGSNFQKSCFQCKSNILREFSLDLFLVRIYFELDLFVKERCVCTNEGEGCGGSGTPEPERPNLSYPTEGSK